MANSADTALVFNIQRYCLDDGDGIRTTIFFKGCPLRCAWCHNPEGQAGEAQSIYYAERCRRCGRCGDSCDYGARETAGTPYTPEELICIAGRDAPFYRTSGGGVTLSGGEVMAQPEGFLLPLVRGLKKKGFHLAIDTCGYAPFEAFEDVLPYTDVFLYDIKMIDSERHICFTGQSNGLILDNIEKLSGKGARLHIRVPVIEGANADDKEMDAIARYLRENVRAEKVTLLPYNGIGEDKYPRIGKDAAKGFSAPDARRMGEIALLFGGLV